MLKGEEKDMFWKGKEFGTRLDRLEGQSRPIVSQVESAESEYGIKITIDAKI